MARAVRSTPLDTRASRLRLDVGVYHYIAIGEGLAIGYRRPTSRGNGTWSVRLWNRKHYIRHTLGQADDHADADGKIVLSFWQAQACARGYATETRPGQKPVTVKEASERYMNWYRDHRKSAKDTQSNIDAHILPEFGPLLVMDLTATVIRHWHERLATQPARKRSRKGSVQAHFPTPMTAEGKRSRKSTANRILTIFKAILNRAFSDGLSQSDVEWRKVKPFRNVEEASTRFLTESECTRLVNAARPDFRLLIKAALFTGARYGELTRLTVRDVDLSNGLIYINPEAKSGKGRHVPLTDEGKDFFRDSIVGKTGSNLVFTKSEYTPWGKNHQRRVLIEACDAAKIEPVIGFHDLRHSYASVLARAGIDLLLISKLLGHADTRITSRHYAHLCDESLRRAVQFVPAYGHKIQEKKLVSIK